LLGLAVEGSQPIGIPHEAFWQKLHGHGSAERGVGGAIPTPTPPSPSPATI
jgi:hypothetical protein